MRCATGTDVHVVVMVCDICIAGAAAVHDRTSTSHSCASLLRGDDFDALQSADTDHFCTSQGTDRGQRNVGLLENSLRKV